MYMEGIPSSIISVQRQEEKVIYILRIFNNLSIMITLFLTATLVFMLDISKLIFNWLEGHVLLSED